jgi:hypothetical protein
VLDQRPPAEIRELRPPTAQTLLTRGPRRCSVRAALGPPARGRHRDRRPLLLLHVAPFQWRTHVSRPLLVLPTAQMSAVAVPATPVTDAHIGVDGFAGTSATLVPSKRTVSVRPWQPE